MASSPVANRPRLSPSPAPAALLLLAVAAGCSTVTARIHGPRFGGGIDLDHNLDVSPRLEAGYEFLQYQDAAGYGGAAGGSYSPVTGWGQVWIEGMIWMFPLLPLIQSGLTFRVGGAFHPDHEPSLVFGVGITGVAYKPPTACFPPLEGPWEGCPPGEWLWTDTVFPDWLPQPVYLATIFPWVNTQGCADPEMGCPLVNHSLRFDAVIAWHTLFGGVP